MPRRPMRGIPMTGNPGRHRRDGSSAPYAGHSRHHRAKGSNAVTSTAYPIIERSLPTAGRVRTMTLTLCEDASAAAWITSSDLPWQQLVAFGPAGFQAYARLRFLPDPAYAGQ